MLARVLKSVFVYGVANILSKVLTTFILPLFVAKYVSKNDFAASDLILSFFTLISLLSSLSLESALGRFFYTDKRKKGLVSSVFVTIILFSALVSLICLALSSSICQYIFNNQKYHQDCIIGVGLIFLNNIGALVNIYLRFSEKIKLFFIVSIFQFICVLLFLLFSYLGHILSSKTILYALVIQQFIGILISVIYFYKLIEITINKNILIDCFKYSIPLIPITVMVWINLYLNRFILQTSNLTFNLPDYMLAVKIASIITLIDSVFVMFWQPFFLKNYLDSAFFSKFKIVFNCLVFCLFFIYLVMVFVYPFFINNYYADKFYQSSHYFGFLCISSIINIFTSLIGIGMNAYNKTFYTSVIFILVTLFGVALSYSLLCLFGIMGLVISPLLTALINLAVVSIVTKKFINIKYNYKYLAIIFILCIIYNIANQFFKSFSTQLLLFIVTIVLILSISYFVFLKTIFKKLIIKYKTNSLWV